MSSDSEEPFEDSFIDPAVLLGVWADATRVHVGRGEFTIDFRRLVPPDHSRGLLVARTIVSPAVALRLIENLQDAWRQYAERAMPWEPNDD